MATVAPPLEGSTRPHRPLLMSAWIDPRTLLYTPLCLPAFGSHSLSRIPNPRKSALAFSELRVPPRPTCVPLPFRLISMALEDDVLRTAVHSPGYPPGKLHADMARASRRLWSAARRLHHPTATRLTPSLHRRLPDLPDPLCPVQRPRARDHHALRLCSLSDTPRSSASDGLPSLTVVGRLVLTQLPTLPRR